MRAHKYRAGLLVGVAAAATIFSAGLAQAQVKPQNIDIRSQPLSAALKEFGVKTGAPVLYGPGLAEAKFSPGVTNASGPEAAMTALLAGTGLTYRRSGETFLIVKKDDGAPQNASANEGAEPSLVEELVVTAQKKEESIQDVPIAVSAFSAQALDERKIEGGPELLRAIPNVSFSKGNFSMYNFSIRGIGTKAVSAGSDPAVAVSFNNSPLIRNRLFEQEFLDVERVEVLRGPQGTLYGRNATAGVVNMIPKLPSGQFEGMMKAELGNYNTGRLGGMVNIPLGDTLAIRAAGAMTKRDGFDYNSFTKQDVNNRDLWSTRLSAKWDPVDWFSANVIWEHFEEDDQRSRTGKQLCTRDPGPVTVGSQTVSSAFLRGRLSQGCLPGSLFKDEAYGMPNGLSFPQFVVGNEITFGYRPGVPASLDSVVRAFRNGRVDPFLGATQSKDLRTINTSYDPVFRAKNDVFQLNLSFDLTDNLQLISQTAYSEDRYYSSQDYNRFVTNPIFNDTNQPLVDVFGAPLPTPTALPGGFYNDPQLGWSDRMVAVDLNKSKNRQWSQELRLQSSFEGPFNFSLGANYLKFNSQDDYYVFNNTFTLLAEWFYNRDTSTFFGEPLRPCIPTATKECVYVDPNPINKVNGQGHNYFRSKNVVQTESWAIFGEAYWDVTETFKLTAGLRYTDDSKTSTPYPSQLLLGCLSTGSGPSTGGRVCDGYPALPDINQGWNEWTGRLVADWKPTLSFTDDTMFYASYARGYKGGGANPPRVDIDPNVVQYQPLAETFKPEYLNAFEIGMKNTLLNGALRLNATAFYYDYKDYQVSQIVDRISLNENFDAKNMGAELEVIWHATPELRFDANVGYLHTELGKGAKSIDVMNRTQGNEDWTLVRPWLQVPSNCIAPTRHVETILSRPFGEDLNAQALAMLCGGAVRNGSFDPAVPTMIPFWLFYGFTYNPLTEAPNGGRGFYADLEGNELPNAPNWTLSLGAQYSFNINEWRLTVRGDYYRQSESYSRVYNTAFDRLEAWDNTNLSATLENPERNMVIQAYVKNVFDETPITDTFTNSDDTGLTSNVFTLDPRIVGVSIMGRF